jgi:thiol-disulfide isomerase/thioredoxin
MKTRLHDAFLTGLPMSEFLLRHGPNSDRRRWQNVHDQVVLTASQRQLLSQFRRETHVLVLAGAWCGDCARQCPIFEHFAAVAPVLQICYVDRDEHPAIQEELLINGGRRVPVVVFFSEDGFEVARFGDRTLSAYRRLVAEQTGDSCASGMVSANDAVLLETIQDWLDQFERVQWILRLSPRLRQKHGD